MDTGSEKQDMNMATDKDMGTDVNVDMTRVTETNSI
jgi:hypothetical protein